MNKIPLSCKKKLGETAKRSILLLVWNWPATPTWCVAYPGNLLGPSPSHSVSVDESDSAWWKQKPREAAGAINRLWRMGICSHTAILPSDLHCCIAAKMQMRIKICKHLPVKRVEEIKNSFQVSPLPKSHPKTSTSLSR